MSTKVFQWVSPYGGADVYGHDLTVASGTTTAEPGLLAVLDYAGATASLAGATGSKPFGFFYGTRDLVYAPTTKIYAEAEACNVLTGHGFVEVSADFFSSGSLPTEAANQRNVYAAASGKLTMATGTNAIGRLIDIKSFYDGTGGTGTAVNVALIEFDFGGTF
jgi:hypothetical protein